MAGGSPGHALPPWPVAGRRRGLAHQDEGVHGIFADLQTRCARHFQKQVRSGFLNLEKKPARFQKKELSKVGTSKTNCNLKKTR